MLDKKVVIIGGTPYDSNIGKEIFERLKYYSICRCVSQDPVSQIKKHTSSISLLQNQVIDIVLSYKNSYYLIFCNSLSFSIDINVITEHCRRDDFVTLKDVYKDIEFRGKKILLCVADKLTFNRISDFLHINYENMQISFLPLLSHIINIENGGFNFNQFQIDISEKAKEIKASDIIVGCTHFELHKLNNLETYNIIYPGQLTLKKMAIRLNKPNY
jgi:glutamate racemase